MNMWIPWWGAIPFVVLLACIALAPLIPHVRDRWAHLPAQLTVALALGIPVGVWMCLRGQPSAVVHALVEYAQFITLLFSLYSLVFGFPAPLILALLLLIGVFLYHGFSTPGDVEQKMKGAYEKTKAQSEEVLKQGKEKVAKEGKKLTKELGRTAAEKAKVFDDGGQADE